MHRWWSYVLPNLVQFGPPPSRVWKLFPLAKIVKSSITQPGIVRFRSNLVKRLSMTLYLLQSFKVKVSKVKVTAWQRNSSEKRCKSGTDWLTDFKLDENYPRVERNTWQMFKVIRSNTEIAITPTRIALFSSNMVQSYHGTTSVIRMFKVKG